MGLLLLEDASAELAQCFNCKDPSSWELYKRSVDKR
jgi:hypothetical protein